MLFRRGLLSACRFLVVAVLAGAVCQLPASTCADCHDQGQKLQASAHASVACATCHLGHDVYPHPEGVPKPACSRCHAAQVGEHAQSVHGLALKRGNAAAPDCAVCHGSAHELAATHTEAFRKKVPHRYCPTVSPERAWQSSGAGGRAGAGLHGLPRGTLHPGTHQPRLAGAPQQHSRDVRAVPRQRAPDQQVRDAGG
jgi:hypothetical protein